MSIPEQTPSEDLNQNTTQEEVELNRAEAVVEETPAEPVIEETKQLTQDEFNKIYFEKKQAERELEALKAKLNQQVQPAPVETGLVKPTLEQFDYDEEAYREALIEYKVDLKLAQKEQAQVATQQQTAAQKVAQTFNDKCAEFEKVNPDYTRALNNTQAVQFVGHVYSSNPHIAQAILESEVGAQLDYHLLANPQEAERLSRLSPANAMKELGKLEMKYSVPVAQTQTQVAPQGKKISTAPDPIPAATGNSRSSGDNWRYDESLSTEEYARLDREEKLARSKR